MLAQAAEAAVVSEDIVPVAEPAALIVAVETDVGGTTKETPAMPRRNIDVARLLPKNRIIYKILPEKSAFYKDSKDGDPAKGRITIKVNETSCQNTPEYADYTHLGRRPLVRVCK